LKRTANVDVTAFPAIIYERLLATGRFFWVGAGKLIDKFRLVRQVFWSDLALCLTATRGLFLVNNVRLIIKDLS